MNDSNSNKKQRVRWIGRILRGVRGGERHSASNHAALFGVPEVISLKSEWFPMEDRCHFVWREWGRRKYLSSFKLEWRPSGNGRTGDHGRSRCPLPRPFVHMIAYRISPDKSSVAETRTWATSPYFPDTRAKPPHLHFHLRRNSKRS